MIASRSTKFIGPLKNCHLRGAHTVGQSCWTDTFHFILITGHIRVTQKKGKNLLFNVVPDRSGSGWAATTATYCPGKDNGRFFCSTVSPCIEGRKLYDTVDTRHSYFRLLPTKHHLPGNRSASFFVCMYCIHIHDCQGGMGSGSEQPMVLRSFEII